MFDGMLTATEVRNVYGADALLILQTMRICFTLGPDRTQPNKYGGTTQLFKTNRAQQAACYAVGGAPAEEYCSQAFFCGLFGIFRQTMLPEQELYFKAGAAIKGRLDKLKLPYREDVLTM